MDLYFSEIENSLNIKLKKIQKIGNNGSMNLGSFELINIPTKKVFKGKALHQKYFSKLIAAESINSGYLLYFKIL